MNILLTNVNIFRTNVVVGVDLNVCFDTANSLVEIVCDFFMFGLAYGV